MKLARAFAPTISSLRVRALGARDSQAWKPLRETPRAPQSHDSGQIPRCFADVGEPLKHLISVSTKRGQRNQYVRISHLSPNAAVFLTPIGAEIGQRYSAVAGRVQLAF